MNRLLRARAGRTRDRDIKAPQGTASPAKDKASKEVGGSAIIASAAATKAIANFKMKGANAPPKSLLATAMR
ncbi:MAG: hypothetical protein QE273_10015, partial [Verrucomicrobiales bacterium]|nr:hypothetical protein [Verrucomicrobiales bacterium]